MRKFKMVKPKEGELISHLGCYVLQWRPEWTEMLRNGEDDLIGFVEIDEDTDDDESATKVNP